MELSLKLMPSRIGQYYELQCDKYLIYYSVGKNEYEKLGWEPPQDFQMNAQVLAGREWEKKLLKRLKEDDSCELKKLKKDKKDKKELSLAETLRGLKHVDKPVFLYQACLGVTPSFAKEYLSVTDGSSVKVAMSSKVYPDFIKVEYSHTNKKFKLTIIDAKNADILKIGAEVQITLYVLLLKSLLIDEKITNCFVNEEEGIVWNREKVTDNLIENVFNLKDARNTLEIFFKHKLPELCDIIASCEDGNQLRAKLDYCISQKCEYCENFNSCKEECAQNKSVRLMPYITENAQQRIKELKDEGVIKDDSIESIKEVLDRDPQKLTEDCSYWNNVKNDIGAYAQGLLNFYEGVKQRFSKQTSSISFPISQNFMFILTAQQDVRSGRTYAYSWLLIPGKGIDICDQGLDKNGYVSIYEGKEKSPGKGIYYDTLIAEYDTDEEFERIDRSFVEAIYELLKKISDYPDSSKRRLQCFVMDDYEKINIENAMFDLLDRIDPDKEREFVEKVVAILFWLQGERLVTDSDYEPEECVENPITVLSSEISRLYVLSEGVAYNLRAVASIFSPDYNYDNEKSTYYWSALSNVVDGLPIIRIWKEGSDVEKQEMVENLAKHLRKRLFIERKIISTIQQDNNKNIHLSAWPMQFRLQKSKYPDNPEVAKLDFENKYEQLLTYHSIRMQRVAGIQNAIDGGAILWLEYTGRGNTYKILNRDSYIGREWFTAWLCEDTPENRLQLMLLRDSDYTANEKIKWSAQFTPYGSSLSFYPADGNHQQYNFSDNGNEATVDFYPKKGADFTPKAGRRYLFFEVYSDFNSEKTSDGISRLVNRPELLEPDKLSGNTAIKYNEHVDQICSQFWSPDGYNFSPSQKKAFIHLVEQKLNVLVGPPASGKTDFISRALITLSSFYKTEVGKSMRILISAMSHSAIENVLLKMDKMLQKANPCRIKLYKAERFDDPRAFSGTSVRLVEAKKVAGTLDEGGIQIVGMTCWSAYKEFMNPKTGKMRIFDMIVIDEASQLRAMDSFIALECSDDSTQFLLVGDDDQLPPIIGGNYKEVEDQKYIYGSIFHMFITALGDDHPDVIHLSDNFRMNAALCRYPAEALYGDEYKAFNNAIATQRIVLAKKSDSRLLRDVLDPEYPLVLCELFGNSRDQNKAEVQVVTQLMKELWNNLLNADSGKPANIDGNFWRNCKCSDGKYRDGACGIISPHHEHINRLRTSIAEALSVNRKDIYIGTVDKLQGKERQAVIVSYGVSETEKIANEAEFIFSSNRFNVSMTRGKAKTIIVLSDVIAESNMKTNVLITNDSTLKKGVDFIHGFVQYMRTEYEGEEMVAEEYPYEYGDVSLKLWKKRVK